MSLKSWLNTIKLHLKSEFCSEKQARFIGLDLESLLTVNLLFLCYMNKLLYRMYVYNLEIWALVETLPLILHFTIEHINGYELTAKRHFEI